MRPNKSYIIAGVIRLGGWLFARRTWIPLPLIAALLVIPAQALPLWWVLAGGAIVLAGEWIRIEAVRQIGVISRTRSERLGPLVDTGPFAWVRNPLYLGNVALWVGFALVARLPWLAPIFAVLLFFEYHAIVSWEEGLLASRIGTAYVEYTTRVPRWVPARPRTSGSRLQAPGSGLQASGAFTWGVTLFSERGTLIAIVLGFALLAVKSFY
jgi:protein-S-isoprenylcysteine O-methyltransferase Ste14